MATKAYLPVGTKTSKETVLIAIGDVLQLVTGEQITFTEMKRTKFHGKINGKTIVVPIYRDHAGTTPFITKVVGKDVSVITPTTPITSFIPTDLFKIEGSKETFMFLGTDVKPRTGKKIVKAIDVATQRTWNIAADMTMTKINLNEVKAKAEELALLY